MALSTEAELGKTYLPDIKVADLSLLGPYADLPIAALRRSNGALPEVRDEARGGENMQIRSIGLPPMTGNNKQPAFSAAK